MGDKKLNSEGSYCYSEDNNTTPRLCNESDDLVYKSNIGLIYISDYTYAAYPSAWNTKIIVDGYDQEAIKNNNWMYMGLLEWTISRNSNVGDATIGIAHYGCVGSYGSAYVYNHRAVRPTFYLTSSTILISGNGSKDSPYRLSI